jgi:hypothetical protein
MVNEFSIARGLLTRMGAGGVGGVGRYRRGRGCIAGSIAGRGIAEPEEIGDEDRIHARSVTLSSERLGLIASSI